MEAQSRWHDHLGNYQAFYRCRVNALSDVASVHVVLCKFKVIGQEFSPLAVIEVYLLGRGLDFDFDTSR